MKNVSFIFTILLIAFSAFGCDGDSSRDNPIPARTYGIVSGNDGLLVFSSTKGKTWSQIDIPGDLSQASFSGVAFSPGTPDKVWVVSQQPDAIMTSTDAGKTWKMYEGELYDCLPVRIEAADAETAWISCFSESNQPLALKTENGGEMWVLQEAGPPLTENGIELQGLSVVNQQIAWMSAGYGPSSESHGLVLRTLDGGMTWEAKAKMEEGDSQLSSDLPYLGIAATSANEAWVVSAHNNNQGSSIYHTTDGGETWTLQASDLVGSGNDLNDIRVTEGVIWIAGDMGTVFRSDDDGASWEKFETASMYNLGVAALDGTTAWAVSSGSGSGAGVIVNTSDSGKTWNKQLYPETSDYQSLSDVAFEKGL